MAGAPLGDATSIEPQPPAARMTARRRTLLVSLAAVVVLACSSDEQASGPDPTDATLPPPSELAAQGGDATVSLSGRDAFGQPVPGLEADDARTFAIGHDLFHDRWVTAPSTAGDRDGLGPQHNAPSCSTCHVESGRGAPPTDADDPARGLLLRLSELDERGEPQSTSAYGDQLQDRTIRGVPLEGRIVIDRVEHPGTYPDGTAYTLVEPRYSIVAPDGTPFPRSILISPRIAPAVFGVGLLEAVPAEAILEHADPDDEDGDGVSGRPNLLTDVGGTEVLGRFGWKASVATVEAQNAGAFAGDIGITSSRHREQPCTRLQAECLAAPDGGAPELADRQLDQVTFYTRTLAVPARRDADRPGTRDGQVAFEQIGCSACHLPELHTGGADVPTLANQTIRPYTDLLLHDMGDGLADDGADRHASRSEWRTPPLWGIGLVPTVNGHTRFLHDGRARDLEEAVLWHGGEAEAARERFTELDAAVRRQLLDFLESL